MTRRVLAVALIVTTISAAQGSLLYAATAVPSEPPPAAYAMAAAEAEIATASLVLPGEGGSGASIECLRGGDYCFGYGTWNCCGELASLLAIAGATGAWAAAGLAGWAYWYYC